MLWVKTNHWVSNTVQNKEFKISQIFYWRYVEMTTSQYIQLNKIYDENYFCYFLFNMASKKTF